jgi:hypothetical protein
MACLPVVNLWGLDEAGFSTQSGNAGHDKKLRAGLGGRTANDEVVDMGRHGSPVWHQHCTGIDVHIHQ